MKQLLIALLLTSPVVDVPQDYRQANWLGDRGQGSCVIASSVTLLRWQNRIHAADYYRKTYGNGQGPDSLAAKFNSDGVRFAETRTGDVQFLEWALRTRRGANVVWMNGRHMLTLVHLDGEQAAILDNNAIDKVQWMPRERFLAEWRASGGWAVTPLYTPMAPVPIYNG
jgi:hypothetical protein